MTVCCSGWIGTISVKRSDVVGKEINCQILVLPLYHGALVAIRRHLDCSTCSFLIWEGAATLQTGHAHSVMDGWAACTEELHSWWRDNFFCLGEFPTLPVFGRFLLTWSIWVDQVSREFSLTTDCRQIPVHNSSIRNNEFHLLTSTVWRRNYFFNFSTPVYKMWIIQEPNKLELWNKLHYKEKKTESINHF